MPLSTVQPERYADLLQEKAARVTQLLAPWCPVAPEIYPSAVTGYRMRAEFRMWHDGERLDYVMFRREDPKTPVPIDSFPVACATIQRANARGRRTSRPAMAMMKAPKAMMAIFIGCSSLNRFNPERQYF